MQKSYCSNTQPHTQQLPWEASWALLIGFELLGFRNETPSYAVHLSVITEFEWTRKWWDALRAWLSFSPFPGGPRSCRLSHSQKLQKNSKIKRSKMHTQRNATKWLIQNPGPSPQNPHIKIDTKLQKPKSKPKVWILVFWDWILEILDFGRPGGITIGNLWWGFSNGRS